MSDAELHLDLDESKNDASSFDSLDEHEILKNVEFEK